MAKPRVPIAKRIDAALAKSDGLLRYHELAMQVFPPSVNPRSWRYRAGGGPPGCYMALNAALRRYGFPIIDGYVYRRASNG